MKPFSLRLAVITGLALMLALTTPSALRADDWDYSTHFSANHALEVPGMVLEPNTTYFIRTAPGLVGRNVVQIFTKDRMELLTQFMVNKETRQQPEDETVFNFMEVPAGNPVPIRSWFYPGMLTGLEFVYSGDQLDKIAAYTDRTAVVQTASLSQDDEALSEGVIVEEDSAFGQDQGVEEDFAVGQGEESTDSSITDEAAVDEGIVDEGDDELAATDDMDELPATSGALPLLGLLGALSMGLGVTSRFARRN